MTELKKISKRRNITSKEAAKKLGVSPRTIVRLVAEDREDYEARANHRREQAYRLKQEGYKVKAIAEKMECTEWAVYSLLRQYREKNNTH